MGAFLLARFALHGDCSSVVERCPVEADVVGSNPISHPKYQKVFGQHLYLKKERQNVSSECEFCWRFWCGKKGS